MDSKQFWEAYASIIALSNDKNTADYNLGIEDAAGVLVTLFNNGEKGE